jgi:hypothetical protein
MHLSDYPATTFAIDSWERYPEGFWHGDIHTYTTSGINRYGEYTSTHVEWLSLSENLIIYLKSNGPTFSDQKSIQVYAYSGIFKIDDGSLRGGTINQLLHINSAVSNPQLEAPWFSAYNYKRPISIDRGLPNQNELEWLIQSNSWTTQSAPGDWSTVTGSGLKNSLGQWSSTIYQSYSSWEEASKPLIDKGYPSELLLEYFPLVKNPSGEFNYDQEIDVYKSLGFDPTRKYNTAPTGLYATSSGFLENIPAGSSVGDIRMFDPDPGDTLVLSLVEGNGDTDNAFFNVSNNELLINHSPDAESKHEYLVRLRATDERGLYIEQKIVLHTYDVAESLDAIIGENQADPGDGAILLMKPARFGKTALENPFKHREGSLIAINVDSFNIDGPPRFKATRKSKKVAKLASSGIDFVFDNQKDILYFNENGKSPDWGYGGIVAQINSPSVLTPSDFLFF